eukprot:c9978_g1_i2.p1 GENE.c9978_g1_i2~~c9978_g1_i2.p1  ORF type:complete len:141 (+),score=27.83 c9978_g1_i2:577-999(+)
MGVAEADPSLDVGGWDTACKLVLIMNHVCHHSCTLADVEVEGIETISVEQHRQANDQGKVIKLVAAAERGSDGRGFALSVKPTLVGRESFLGSISPKEMGITFESDIYSKMSMKIEEWEPIPTAAAVLRDLVTIAKEWRR